MKVQVPVGDQDELPAEREAIWDRVGACEREPKFGVGCSRRRVGAGRTDGRDGNC